MYRKLKNIIAHPSVIGLYFMDHWYQVLGFWFCFFAISMVLLAVVDLNKSKIDGNTAIRVSDSIIYRDFIEDAVFKDDTLSGSVKQIETEYCLISFNNNGFKNDILYNGILLVYGMENVNMYYGGIHLGGVSYKDLNIDDFSMEEIKNGNISMRLSFEALIHGGLSSGEMNYRAVCFFGDFTSALMYYLVAFLVCFLLGKLLNPLVERRFRLKLVAYDTIIFFIFVWLDILTSAGFLIYVGMVLSLIYTIITFTHIRAVRIGRRINR